MKSEISREVRRHNYFMALIERNLPYYALAGMVDGACTGLAINAFTGEDSAVMSVRYDYLWHITNGIASRMQLPVPEGLLTGYDIVQNIVPGLARVSLLELGAEALAGTAVHHTEFSSIELGVHAAVVNTLMVDVHAELYETDYDLTLLPAIMLG